MAAAERTAVAWMAPKAASGAVASIMMNPANSPLAAMGTASSACSPASPMRRASSALSATWSGVPTWISPPAASSAIAGQSARRTRSLSSSVGALSGACQSARRMARVPSIRHTETRVTQSSPASSSTVSSSPRSNSSTG
jgi:hypothetical protein